MPLTAFDHVNVRTANLEGMVAWYDDVLGLTSGKRPPFPFPGAWLYLGDQAVIHLVGIEAAPDAAPSLQLEHIAFRAEDMPAFVDRLTVRGIAHSIDPVPSFPIMQVNLHDPDGNHLHIDFDIAEHRG